jgi:hypothetical protein
LQEGSDLTKAMRKAGKNVPSILIAIGGAGRSSAFKQMAGNGKARKRLAQRIAQVFEEFPLLAGVDLDWETPQTAEQYRDLGKLAVEIRKAVEKLQDPSRPSILLTMTYHPLVGAIQMFASLQSKSSGKRFVDLFDLCHSMAYSKYDDEKRHSTFEVAAASIEEWSRSGLPASRLTLGLPFFGLNTKTGDHRSYAELLEDEPSLSRRPQDDMTSQSFYFNGPDTLVRKVALAAEKNIGGVMIWEVGQDHRVGTKEGPNSLLKKIWNAARSKAVLRRGNDIVPQLEGGWWGQTWETIMENLPSLNEDNLILALSILIGTYYSFRTLTAGHPQHRLWAAERRRTNPPRPKSRKEPPAEAPAGADADGTVTDAADAPADGGDASATEEAEG